MGIRSVGVSEARRRLPEIVRTIADEGGRVDVTVRGHPRVSIVRTADVVGQRSSGRQRPPGEALRVEFAIAPGALVAVIRDLRSRIGLPRAPGAHARRRPVPAR